MTTVANEEAENLLRRRERRLLCLEEEEAVLLIPFFSDPVPSSLPMGLIIAESTSTPSVSLAVSSEDRFTIT